MNKIVCDKCNNEIKTTKDLIETKHLHGGVNINFFRCRKCGEKTLIDVTDIPTRFAQIQLRKWAEQREKALSIVIDNLSGEELEKITMLADECLFNIDRLQGEIKAAKAELKEKYKGEL
jgi:DNA-directed RNA polymerase subunit M/transcription elongation factor TFIIS